LFPEQFPQTKAGLLIASCARMTQSLICERAFEFAARALDLGERLWSRGPAARHIASQLMECSTSIGANAEEAQEGQTKPDYIAKMSVSRKEAREAGWWLRLAVRARKTTSKEIEWELNEARQLLAMIRAAIKTARSSASRGESVSAKS
jgi:four helix bundle protein